MPMLDSGERYVDEGPKNWELFYQHTGRCLFAREQVRGKVVLDAACGTGHGAAILAEAAHLVVGLDHSREALFYCRHRHQRALSKSRSRILRTCLPEGIRSRNWLAAQVWAHKCNIGEVAPYLMGCT